MHHPMGPMSWLIIIAIILAMFYPYIRILRRAGFSGWWFLTMFVPIVNMVMIWIFAFVKMAGGRSPEFISIANAR